MSCHTGMPLRTGRAPSCKVNRRHAEGEWEVQLDGGAFREIIGQGTPDLRQFHLLAGRLAWRRTARWGGTAPWT